MPKPSPNPWSGWESWADKQTGELRDRQPITDPAPPLDSERATNPTDAERKFQRAVAAGQPNNFPTWAKFQPHTDQGEPTREQFNEYQRDRTARLEQKRDANELDRVAREQKKFAASVAAQPPERTGEAVALNLDEFRQATGTAGTLTYADTPGGLGNWIDELLARPGTAFNREGVPPKGLLVRIWRRQDALCFELEAPGIVNNSHPEIFKASVPVIDGNTANEANSAATWLRLQVESIRATARHRAPQPLYLLIEQDAVAQDASTNLFLSNLAENEESVIAVLAPEPDYRGLPVFRSVQLTTSEVIV